MNKEEFLQKYKEATKDWHVEKGHYLNIDIAKLINKIEARIHNPTIKIFIKELPILDNLKHLLSKY